MPTLADVGFLKQISNRKYAFLTTSGTSSIQIMLLALGIEPGDEIISINCSAPGTVMPIKVMGANAVYCDLNEYGQQDLTNIESLITDKTRAIIPVSLFGQPADMDVINYIAEKNNLIVIEDGAQSFGAEFEGRKSCNLSHIGCTSFFPSKPLGCYGDGGAIFTNDDHLADLMSSIKNHGMGSHKYEHVNIGLNSRLDTLQAAILNQKIELLDLEIKQRNEVAEKYNKGLEDSELILPTLSPEKNYAWAQYTIRHKRRDLIIQELRKRNIPTAIYYPIPFVGIGMYSGFTWNSSGSMTLNDKLKGADLGVVLSFKTR